MTNTFCQSILIFSKQRQIECCSEQNQSIANDRIYFWGGFHSAERSNTFLDTSYCSTLFGDRVLRELAVLNSINGPTKILSNVSLSINSCHLLNLALYNFSTSNYLDSRWLVSSNLAGVSNSN
jgi:hypothetical protein